MSATRRDAWPAWTATALLAVAALIVAALVLRPGAPLTADQQAQAIAAELRCPDCAGLSAADSPTQAAAEIRRQVADMLAAGMTDDQIKATFVARYGDWILLTPPGPLSWLVPLVVTLGGAAVLGWWLLGRRAASTRPTAAESAGDGEPAAPATASTPVGTSRPARQTAVAAGLVLASLVGIGYLLPEPLGLAAHTVVNQPLAEAQAAEAARQAAIEQLLAAVAGDPTDVDALTRLADAYLAGSTADDLRKAAITLLAVIGQEPDNTDAYAKLITAYIRASDWTDAEAATDALAVLTPDSPDIPFFRGLIAWDGHHDAAAALEQFDAFLAQAPDDPRATMIKALRAEAAGQGG